MNSGQREQEQSPSVTSLTLLDRIRTNDAEGWRRLVRIYAPLVYGWCRRKGLHEEDAADISQEVFRTVTGRIGDFRRDRSGDSFRGWLWTITRHKIGDHLRRNQRQPVAAGGSDACHQFQEVPEQGLDEADSVADSPGLVQRALELLRPEFQEKTWQMFWRAAVEGEAPKDIAADLSVTPDAVRMAKSRVLHRIREELVDWEMS